MYYDYRRIENYPDYIVSNYGEVYSLKRGRVRELKSFKIGKSHSQYLAVELKKKTFTIHVLVGNAFIGKREGEMTFDHIDRNKLNNRADNIRLATKSEQAINKNLGKNNSSGHKNIRTTYQDNNCYWHVDIRRNKKRVFQKRLNKKKFSLDDAIKVRDEFLTSELNC